MAILSEVCRYRHAGGAVGVNRQMSCPRYQPAGKIQQAIPQTGRLRVKFATKDVCYSTFHFLTTA
ncbi:hypothetical protein [Paraburkholderia caribensis]|uniref:hypothetical protein n=1 Tax=Paraburkholderia caribensis TaxID=75105 RepID=UPI0011E01B7E|nr:hypothetical protein [Paraburkholderia caribensis]